MIKLILKFGNEQPITINEAELYNNHLAIYRDGGTYGFISVKPTNEPGTYVNTNDVNHILAEFTKTIDIENTIEDLKTVISNLSLYDYLTKVNQQSSDSLELIPQGGSKVIGITSR